MLPRSLKFRSLVSGHRPGSALLALALPIPVAGGLLAACGSSETPAPEEEPVVEAPAPVEPEPAPEPPPPPPAPPPPTTGSLDVTGPAGAAVLLDGRRLGSSPGTWEDIEAGEYTLRVEQKDHRPFEVTVTIAAGRTRSVEVELLELLGSIRVETDVPGAMVFLDRNFKGNAPLTIPDLRPGEYRLTVSADGHEVQNRNVEVAREPVAVRFDLVAAETTLDVQVELVHKHRFGSCSGTLHAGAEGFDYRTDHRDAFQLPFDRVGAFEFDYVNNNLRLQVSGGRTYNFESPSEDRDAVFLFHEAVTAYRASTSND